MAWRNRSLLAVPVLTATLVAACSDRVVNIPVGGDGADFTVSQRIGSRGGSLTVDDPASPIFGTEITVPADAVSDTATLTVSPAPDGAAAPPFGLRAVGPVVRTSFPSIAAPATIVLPYQLDALEDEELL